MAVLVTGADGYLVRRLLAKYLGDTDEGVIAFVRARDEEQLRAKTAPLRAQLAGHGARVAFVGGDLAAEDGLAGVDPGAVTRIVHAAAVTAFNVDAETAQRVNVEGTRRVLELARRCRRLESAAVLSTVYASGLRPGAVDEAPLDGAHGFANHYERSKWRAEADLVEGYDDLPWQLFRIATVLADDEGGRIVQFNVVHKIWRLLYRGLLPLVPGAAATPLHLVTGDFATEAIFRGIARGRRHGIYHVCHRRAEALPLGQWVDLAYEAFRADDAFRARRILKPLFVDEEAFFRMAENATMFSQDTLRHVVQLVRPFAKQMFVDKDFANGAMLRDCFDGGAGYRAPDLAALLARTCRELLRTGWGLDGPGDAAGPGGGREAGGLRVSDGGA